METEIMQVISKTEWSYLKQANILIQLNDQPNSQLNQRHVRKLMGLNEVNLNIVLS